MYKLSFVLLHWVSLTTSKLIQARIQDFSPADWRYNFSRKCPQNCIKLNKFRSRRCLLPGCATKMQNKLLAVSRCSFVTKMFNIAVNDFDAKKICSIDPDVYCERVNRVPLTTSPIHRLIKSVRSNFCFHQIIFIKQKYNFICSF